LLTPCKLLTIVSFNKQDLAKHLPRKQQLVLVVEDKLPLINPNRSLGRLLSFYPHIDVSLGHFGFPSGTLTTTQSRRSFVLRPAIASILWMLASLERNTNLA
jgi:hypothetical protein